MSTTEQCPSTGKAGAHATRKRDEARALSGARAVSSATGKAYWRSLDDMVGTKAFRDFVEREFPAHASELLDGSRRHFLKIMGASLALAGATTIPGCRRPDHKILAYNTAPEGIVPGKPLYYATAMPLPTGGCEGLLATTFEGRPTKLEGNPLHPYNRGKSSVWSQAFVLGLYDPDRAPEIARERTRGTDHEINPTRWDDFASRAANDFGAFDATNGRRLAFLVDKNNSPSRDRLKREAMRRWPEAAWVAYSPADNVGELRGTEAAFGTPMIAEHRLEQAQTIVCLDHDLLGTDGRLTDARAYARKRFVPGDGERYAADAEMSRLYVVESRMSATGGQADHRLPVRASRVGAFAIDLAKALAGAGVSMPGAITSRLAGLSGGEAPEAWTKALVDDLWGPNGSKRGTSVITCGASQPAWVHALVAALNEALGNVGKSVVYRPAEGDMGADSERGIGELVRMIDGGSIDTLVILGGNPVYDAPADANFASRLDRINETVYLGEPNETASKVTTYLHVAHDLETWGDALALDGTHSVIQPMIAPLYGGKSQIELLAMIMGMDADGYIIVRETMAQKAGVPRTIAGAKNTNYEKLWRRSLHDGVVNGTTNANGQRPTVNGARVAGAIDAQAVDTMNRGGVEALFQPCPKVFDGRYANNGWLQELPDAVGKIAWDNPVQMSRATAERLGLNPSRKLGAAQYNEVQVVEIALGGQTIQAPLWVQPGMPDDQVVLTLGYGRRAGGRICEGTGVDVYPLRRSGAMTIAQGVEVSRARGRSAYLIATTQDHWSLESRDGIVREVDLYWWKQEGDTNFNVNEDGTPKKDSYKRKRDLRPAEMLGIEGHAPNNEEIYLNRPGRRGSEIYYHRVNSKGKAIKLDDAGITFVQNDEGKYVECGPLGEIVEGSTKKPKGVLKRMHPLNKNGGPVQQWGMSIDLNKCTGCGACITACQAENNIPIVGKKEVAKGREMHWIRVDRYFASDKMDDSAWAEPDMVVQPVTCMHCENAPCEVVCPVNATVHGDQGTNDMAYNRCIGTRYCSNNCPYKVRRFNYFDYATKKYKGEVYGAPSEAVVPENTNLVPPRLREKVDEVRTMQNNPNVTVRSRGVMEKCTYCMQRINAASVETKLEDLDIIPEGFFEVACQQACPAEAIVFGDIYNNVANDGKGSLVGQQQRDPRTYALLSYLAVHPRTTYMMRIRNPHPVIRPHTDHNPFRHHGGDEGHDGDHSHNGEAHSSLSLPVLNNSILSSGGALA
ncbi:MAG: hypothetical protein Tsb0013_10560 [Phycisphaerales bacterium]